MLPDFIEKVLLLLFDLKSKELTKSKPFKENLKETLQWIAQKSILLSLNLFQYQRSCSLILCQVFSLKGFYCETRKTFVKGCVRYIFASLFFTSKGDYLWDREKCFLFDFKPLLVLEIIKFELFRYSNVMASLNTKAWNSRHCAE